MGGMGGMGRHERETARGQRVAPRTRQAPFGSREWVPDSSRGKVQQRQLPEASTGLEKNENGGAKTGTIEPRDTRKHGRIKAPASMTPRAAAALNLKMTKRQKERYDPLRPSASSEAALRALRALHNECRNAVHFNFRRAGHAGGSGSEMYRESRSANRRQGNQNSSDPFGLRAWFGQRPFHLFKL